MVWLHGGFVVIPVERKHEADSNNGLAVVQSYSSSLIHVKCALATRVGQCGVWQETKSSLRLWALSVVWVTLRRQLNKGS